jgi:NADH:ubiquinone oxidoreductase subunit
VSRAPHDPTQVSPEWHGWLHYTHDKPGNVLVRSRCPPLHYGVVLQRAPCARRRPANPARSSVPKRAGAPPPPPPLSPQAAEHEKPFKMALPINQSMQRPEFGRESEFHQPPGTMAARIVRGKVGPKYESWSGSVQTTNPALRNYSDNEKTLHIP